MKTLDCRGLPCPQPVIRCRELVNTGAQDVTVLVDNDPARENVERFLIGRGYTVQWQQDGPQLWRLEAHNASAMPHAAAAEAAPHVTPHVAPDGHAAEIRTLVLITTEGLGRGDATLGEKLMANFLASLPEMGPRLWRVVLLNGGVKLAASPGPALDALKNLAAAGTSVLVCGTCLSHYGLLDAKAVGETSNMLDIVTSLDLADKVIRP